MKISRLLIVSFCSLVAVTVVSGKDVNSSAGTSAFPFLKIDASARAVSMGGAFTGLANDESALFYNPAGIAHFEEPRFILGYHNYFLDMQSGFAGYIKNLGFNKAFGVYVSYLNYGDFTQTDQNGTVTGEFSGGDLLLAFSFAMRRDFYSPISYGGTAKIIYEKIQEFSATGVALDLGVKYRHDRDRYSAGITVQNLGAQLSSLGEEKDKLPLTFRGGGAYNPKGIAVTIASDVIVPTDNDLIIAVGGEYHELKPFYIRLGWNSFGSNYRTSDSQDNWAGLGVGVGFDFKKMQVSYAFTPAADLGESHRITLTGGI